MSSSSPQLVSLFGEALACASAEERAAYLDRAGGGDAELRVRLEALLQAHQQAGNFLAGNSAPAGAVPPAYRFVSPRVSTIATASPWSVSWEDERILSRQLDQR